MSVRRTGEEIVDQVARAAYRLFIQRGPAAVTVREVAAEAGVNSGLIHRYVGSKEDIIALVLDRHGQRAADALAAVTDLAGVIDLLAHSPRTSSGRLFAGVAMDSVDIVSLKEEFPVIRRLVDALADEDLPEDPAVMSALMQSLTLGWELFSPYLLTAAGEAAPEDEEAVLRRALLRLLGQQEKETGVGHE